MDYRAVRLAYGLRGAGNDEPGLVLHVVFNGRGRAPRWRLAIATGEYRPRCLSAVVVEPDRGRRILGRFRGLLGSRSQYHVARQLSGETGAHDADRSGVDHRLCFPDADYVGPRIRLAFSGVERFGCIEPRDERPPRSGLCGYRRRGHDLDGRGSAGDGWASVEYVLGL